MLIWVACLRAGLLGGRVAFVMDRATSLGENVWRYVLHVVRGLRMFGGFVENFVFGAAAYFEITSGVYIAAFQDFCHDETPCKLGGLKSQASAQSLPKLNLCGSLKSLLGVLLVR